MAAICGIVSKFAAKNETKHTMRRTIYVLCVVALAATMLSGCLKSNDSEATYYEDTALTTFTLGTLNRYLHTTAKDGSDSVYKATFSGTSYALNIDQLNGKVFNTDSLPIGTDLKHVVCTLTAYHNGLVLIKSTTSDSLFYVTATDSIDFSVPRLLRVFASSGQHYRDYTVTLVAKQSNARGIAWTEGTAADTDLFATDEALLERTQAQGLTLVGNSRKELFALTGNGQQLMASTDGGYNWGTETLASDAALLPQLPTGTTTWAYAPAGDADYTLLVGATTALDDRLSVWRKITIYDDDEVEGQWKCLTTAAIASRFCLPAGISVALAYTDATNGVLAFGSNGSIYRSLDQGISWNRDTTYAMPTAVVGPVSVKTTSDGALWLQDKATKRVWKGALLK